MKDLRHVGGGLGADGRADSDGGFGPALSRRGFCSRAAAAATLLAGALASGCTSDGGDTSSDGEDEQAVPAQSAAGDTGGESPAASMTVDTAEQELVSRAFFAFNTIVTVKAYGASQELLDDVEAACAHYENLFSMRVAGSDIDRLNRAGGQPVEVDPDTADLLSRALEFCELFDGSFDITVGSVTSLWDFVNGVKPSDEEIAEAITHVDYHGLTVEGTTATLADPKAMVDLGGIAKGWIVERLQAMLVEAGVTSGYIDLGSSSIYVLGTKPDGTPWRLGLRDPANAYGGSMAGTIDVHDTAVVTSGLYDQHFEVDGVDYYHILDPKTGYPAKTDMLACSIILPFSMEGDGMSTALFVKGIDASLKWIEDHPDLGVGALFTGNDDEPVMTPGFEEEYSFVRISDGVARAGAAEEGTSGSASADGR